MSDELIRKAEKIIQKHTSTFLDRTKRYTQIGKPLARIKGGEMEFSALRPAYLEYLKFTEYHRMITGFIREHLINDVIEDLFSITTSSDNKPIIRPEREDCFLFGGFADSRFFEDKYGYEFIIQEGKDRIGVRYLDIDYDNYKTSIQLMKYKVKGILIIDWSDPEALFCENLIKIRKILGKNITKPTKEIKRISVRSFFNQAFSEDIYRIYLELVRKAIDEAYLDIGYQTIPQMSLQFLSSFKEELGRKLEKDDFKSLRFQVIDLDNERLNRNAEKILSNDDYETIDRMFRENELYGAFTGTENFAKCFVTSEYLYQIFKEGGKFEFTAVVSGYLKAVEQLLYTLVINTPYNENLFIDAIHKTKTGKQITSIPNTDLKGGPKGKKIRFKEEYEDFFDKTMTSYIWFLSNNTKSWNISREGSVIVREYLLNYCNEDRNQHFHRDNITNFNEVEIIRNNTKLVMYLLLGGYRFNEKIEAEKRILGIESNDFDNLYRALAAIPLGVKYFFIRFKNEEEIKAIRFVHQEYPEYDESGSLKPSLVKFVKVDDFNVDMEKLMRDLSGQDVFYLSKDNIPDRMWFYIPRTETREEVFW